MTIGEGSGGAPRGTLRILRRFTRYQQPVEDADRIGLRGGGDAPVALVDQQFPHLGFQQHDKHAQGQQGRNENQRENAFADPALQARGASGFQGSKSEASPTNRPSRARITSSWLTLAASG